MEEEEKIISGKTVEIKKEYLLEKYGVDFTLEVDLKMLTTWFKENFKDCEYAFDNVDAILAKLSYEYVKKSRKNFYEYLIKQYPSIFVKKLGV